MAYPPTDAPEAVSMPVVVIEANDELRRLLARVVVEAGLRVAAPEDGPASRHCLESPASAIIYDPDTLFSGHDLLPEVRDRSLRGLPTIVVTAYPEARRSRCVDAVACIETPFDIRQLAAVVTDAVKKAAG